MADDGDRANLFGEIRRFNGIHPKFANFTGNQVAVLTARVQNENLRVA